jgi:hypothetical protein
MLREGDELALRTLDSSLSQFKKFHATRKFKAAAKAVSVVYICVTVVCVTVVCDAGAYFFFLCLL